MARFSDYVDSSYLPGEVYNSGLSEYREDPQFIVDYLTKKKFKFADIPTTGSIQDSLAKPGSSFERFLNLQNNPESLFTSKMRLPQKFQEFQALSNLGT
jgi:hypothetical protein